MSAVLDLSELSVVFISYDEPDADANFAVLREVVPEAIRVHGIKGFDAAHQAAGRAAKTPHVITVDGDNVITDPEFFTRRLQFSPEELTMVISFSARIAHNGLTYGNGGLKVWPRTMLTSLRTHEASYDGAPAVDFAWRVPYLQSLGTPSETVVTRSPYQAFRAGFREGVRLTMREGVSAIDRYPDLPPGEALCRHILPKNLERLQIWCSVGRDTENGAIAILGARMGAVRAALDGLDISIVADFDQINALWEEEVAPIASDASAVKASIAALGIRIRNELDLEIADLAPNASAFIRSIYRAPLRLGALRPD